MFITENVKQQLRFKKQFAFNKVTYKAFDGVYTWFADTQTLYYKGNNESYFSEKGKCLGNVTL
jgi:hypothetical protein